MKLLFITDLYPEQPRQPRAESNRCLHQLVRELKRSIDVAVINLFAYNILQMPKAPVLHRNHRFVMDDVAVWNHTILRTPLSTYRSGRLLKQVAKPDVDAVAGELPPGCAFAHAVARRIKKPLILGLHGSDIRRAANGDNRPMGAGYHRFLSDAAKIACRSPWIEAAVRHRCPQHAAKVFMASPGIEERIVGPPGAGQEKLNDWKRGNPLRIVTACRLLKKKNVDCVLKALQPLKEVLDWRYTIIGDGPEYGALQALSEELGLGGRTVMTGALPHDQVLTELAGAHILVQVSQEETFGQVYLEGLANGLLVIGTRNDGIDGIIKHEENGFLVNARNHGELTRLLEKIVRDIPKESLVAVIAAGHRSALAHTVESQSAVYLNHLRQAVSGSGRAHTKSRNG